MYGVVSGSVIRMGMWSDDISWTVCQEMRMARDGEAREMSWMLVVLLCCRVCGLGCGYCLGWRGSIAVG